MSPNPFFLTLLICCFLFSGCKEKKAENFSSTDKNEEIVRHAEGLGIYVHEGWTQIIVKQPWKGASQELRYALIRDDQMADSIPPGHIVLQIPLQHVAATSTTHLPHFELLELTDRLKGFANGVYIYSPQIREKLQSGSILEIGDGTGINYETALNLRPEAIFTFSMGNDRTVSERLADAGIQQLYNADYLETSPLGRAEWIKFTAAFFDKLAMADSVFGEIEARYLALKEKAGRFSDRPAILTGVVYGETWFLPGGKNYGAAFFEDAGGNYLWKDNSENGWLELSFEVVYEQAANADFWIGTASFSTIAELVAQEDRYQLFKPVRTGQVYNYDRQLNPNGGNNYLEEGYSRPDLVLEDLIHILHPEALPDHQLHFFRKLP